MKDWTAGQGDLADTLRRIVPDIWGAADFGALYETHLHRDAIFRGADHVLQGRVAIATAALQPIASFPGRRLIVEDCAAAAAPGGTEVGAVRVIADGHYAGQGLFGPTAARPVRYRVLMEAASKGGRIGEIWRLRDSEAVFAALGLDPETWAAARLGWDDRDTAPFRPAIDEPGAYTGRGPDDGWAQAWADLLDRAMEGDFGLFAMQVDPGAEIVLPGARQTFGPEGTREFWLGLRAAFPSARFEVQHRFGSESPLLSPRAYLRWSLAGRHDGPGLFGAPSGAEVHIMGMSQAEFGPEGLRREWSLIDTGAIWMQIKAQTG